MKVSDIITESVSTQLENGLDFNELSSIHIGTLRALSDNRVDFENASDRMIEMIETLQVMGFVDTQTKLTSSGTKAVELAKLLGGSRDRRRAASMDDVEIDTSDIYDDDYAGSDDFDDLNSAFQGTNIGAAGTI